MLTPVELSKLIINGEVAREALDQASKRLSDLLETRKSYDQKAFTLFSAFLTLGLGLLGAGVALWNGHRGAHLVAAVLAAGAFFISAAGLLVQALRDHEYGVMGSDPELWLIGGVIDNATALPWMLAYVAHSHQIRIDTSARGNARKAFWIGWGIALGVAAPFLAAIAFAVPVACLKALL